MSNFTMLLLLYLFMVGCNVAAIAKYNRSATDGFAVSYAQPDAQTFSIWGVIYALLLLLVFRANALYPQAAHAMAWSFVFNGAWLLANGAAVVYDLSYWLAVWILVLYAAALAVAYTMTSADYLAPRPWIDKLTLFAPISANLSWVVLACLLNLTNTIMDERVDFTQHENHTRVGGPDWAMGILGLASLLSILNAWTRSDVVYSAVTVWALLGVSRAQTAGHGFPHVVNDALKQFADQAAVAVGVMSLLGVAVRWLGWWTSAFETPANALTAYEDGAKQGYVAFKA